MDELKILRTEKIVVDRRESNFDRACERAYDLAVMMFRIDDCGHSEIEEWERSDCHIEVEFKGYTHTGDMTGHRYTYEFEARAVKYIEDYDDEED